MIVTKAVRNPEEDDGSNIQFYKETLADLSKNLSKLCPSLAPLQGLVNYFANPDINNICEFFEPQEDGKIEAGNAARIEKVIQERKYQ